MDTNKNLNRRVSDFAGAPRNLLSQFIELLMRSEDLPATTQEAIALFAPYYGILCVEGKLECSDGPKGELHHAVENAWYAPADFNKESLLELIDVEDSISLTYQLEGDDSLALLRAYHGRDTAPWNNMQRQEITDFLNVLLLALSKSRLIDTLRRNALIEPATSLPNTAGFFSHANQLIELGELWKYNAFYFNLKSFGLVNRRFGKNETDRIMIRYANSLRAFVEEGECVARLGGDNFIALIRKEKTENFLNFIAGVETVGYIDGEEIPLVIKAVAGCLELDRSLEESEEIIGRCNMALQLAKNVEKVPYIFVTPELNSLVYQHKQIVQQFPTALANKEFKVFYQPKVDTANNMIVGAEALIRWFNDGRIIPPSEFVPVIEKDGSICQLDFYVLESVCHDIHNWMENGIKPVRISTNFSRRNLSHPDFAEHILNILKKYETPREYIEVEITESTEEAENELLINFMNAMHDEKIATAIDDFGTGYTSLNILSDFSVDVLKIDKSFIERHTRSEKDNVVLSNVVKMAKELDMTIINEGVENWEQVDFLQNIGSTVVQGFLFDKPLPEESFRQRLMLGKYDIAPGT